jgi:hypothetical protein
MDREIAQKLFRVWITAAWRYYYGSGENTGMSDREWDNASRDLHAVRGLLPEDEFAVLRDEQFEPGQSIFWLSRDKYPEYAKG